jgi:hypothetical protein
VTRAFAICIAAAGLVLVPLAAAPARAQSSGAVEPGTIKIGPLSIKPTFQIKNIGRDNNVFNETVNPKEDFTMTLSPAADFIFQPRRVKLTYTQTADYVYFHTYSSERGTNLASSARVDLDLGVLQPYVGTSGADTRARLNHEIDARARHNDRLYLAGVTANVFTRTSVTAGVRQFTTRYDRTDDCSVTAQTCFRGQSLADSLNSRIEMVEGGVRMALTPLTSVGVQLTKERQIFEVARERDSDTVRIMPTILFSPLGLVNGSVAVGHRKFTARDPATPDFSGLVVAVTSGVTLFDRHRVDVSVNRDLTYSYDRDTPYFVGNSVNVTWTYALAGPVDFRGSVTRDRMKYESSADAAPTQHDNFEEYGIGIGVRVRRRLRVGVQGDFIHRDSQKSADRTYDNHRIYGTLTWGR